MTQPRIISGTSHVQLSNLISERLGIQLTDTTIKRSKNGEISVKIETSIRNQDVFIIQSSSEEVNDHLMELLIIINACKSASAKRITAVIPYFPYSKHSKNKKQRGGITAKLVADMLYVSGVHHIITIDLHNTQMQGFFKIPIDELQSKPSISKWIMSKFPDYKDGIVVSKNSGGAKRVTSLADWLGVGFALIHHDTSLACESQLTLAGTVKDKIDDIIDNCQSFLRAAEHLKQVCKASSIIIIATHGIFSGDSLDRIEECEFVKAVCVSNTYPIPITKIKKSSKLSIIDITGTLSEAIRRTHNAESISFLFTNAL